VGEGVLSSSPRPGAATDPTSVEPVALLGDAGIERRNGVLHAAGVSLPELAGRFGTPTYVYNADVVRRQYRALDAALAGTPHQICFAVKANGNLGVLRVLRDLGAGADIVSAGELARSLAAGFDPAKIVFSGVGKRPDELRAAARARIGHVNVESLDEVAALAEAADAEAVAVDVGIRVNPDVSASTHPYISTGKGGIKFGVPVDQVVEAARRIAAHPRLRLTTLAMHIGSQLTDVAPYVQGALRLAELVEAVRALGVGTLEVLDVGGGLGIRYRDEQPLDPRRWAEAVTPVVRATGLALHLEPGRYLVGAAGVLLTRVLYRKHSGGKEFVIVDAGMNDLERPSRYQAYHAIVPVAARAGAPLTADVVGPVCETGDFFAIDRDLAPLEAGDLVAVLGAGAYGFAMASNYNTRPLPAEVIVEHGAAWLARPRQAVEDLFRDERVSSEAP
jgi:diaminopimelate decarboxylase